MYYSMTIDIRDVR